MFLRNLFLRSYHLKIINQVKSKIKVFVVSVVILRFLFVTVSVRNNFSNRYILVNKFLFNDYFKLSENCTSLDVRLSYYAIAVTSL